ncbi:Asp23/Gls24 family envelope stress response protein [Bacillus timonensis]|uniref:Asp23/Gls24 family envelope stress response protein n=1 Tax=Bacillus timonensis TaxID=1033734 RepID=A0A4S3PWW5_9BACI|nr:Asp23/Gls24 family envelope stress response protein [Bacillus timonensis]THE14350.1 Asp23/Gls24 family envelope stress response protein [Bacillus timonensis]
MALKMRRSVVGMVRKSLENGSLYIKNDVLAMIASICAEETEGVTIVSGLKDGVSSILHRNFHKNGITVIEEEEGIALEVKIAVEYGLEIKKTCERLQQAILHEIKSMTDISVSSLTIKVEGLTNSKVLVTN